MSLLGGKRESVIGRGDSMSSGIRQSKDSVSVAMSRVDGRVQYFISISGSLASGSVATSGTDAHSICLYALGPNDSLL